MIYAIMKTGNKMYFDTIDALFEFFNSNQEAAGGWLGS
jgi:hypothetical protein